jgi:hypothetical protein
MFNLRNTHSGNSSNSSKIEARKLLFHINKLTGLSGQKAEEGEIKLDVNISERCCHTFKMGKTQERQDCCRAGLPDFSWHNGKNIPK